MDILSNWKAILGALKKQYPPETAFHAKLCQMGLWTKSHDPSTTNQKLGRQFCYPFNKRHQLRHIKCATRTTQYMTEGRKSRQKWKYNANCFHNHNIDSWQASMKCWGYKVASDKIIKDIPQSIDKNAVAQIGQINSIFLKYYFAFNPNIRVTDWCFPPLIVHCDKRCTCRLHFLPFVFARQFTQLVRGKIWDYIIEVLVSKLAILTNVDF